MVAGSYFQQLLLFQKISVPRTGLPACRQAGNQHTRFKKNPAHRAGLFYCAQDCIPCLPAGREPAHPFLKKNPTHRAGLFYCAQDCIPCLPAGREPAHPF